jgi:hypothetical protein
MVRETAKVRKRGKKMLDSSYARYPAYILYRLEDGDRKQWVLLVLFMTSTFPRYSSNKACPY